MYSLSYALIHEEKLSTK